MQDEQIEKAKEQLLLKPLESSEELRDWVYLFLDIYMPMGYTDTESNSSSVECMWEIYTAVRDNKGQITPSYILLASRESYKTLSASILEILLMLHFRTTIAHCAAIESQSQKAVQYCTTFIKKLMPYITANGWKSTSTNKRRIELTTDDNQMCYIQIIILTLRGANSEHCHLMFEDEVDLCDPVAHEEAKMIPGTLMGKFPLTIRLSTRKFAFGLMEKEIQLAKINNSKILRWNILDVTEHCGEDRCLSHLPLITRYIARNLPLRQLSVDEYNQLEEKDRNDWEKIEAYQGCTKCKLLSVCHKKLHDKTPIINTGDLWKPIDFVINRIGEVDPDVAEAQLLCWKPSSKGLIYSRFNSIENVLSVQQAWEMISGLDTQCNFNMLTQYIQDLGIRIEGGIDWGYTNEFAVIISAILPGGKSLIFDMFAAPNLELDDCVQICQDFQDKYKVSKWWADQAYPAYIKTFNRKGLKCPKFIKDVPLGIEAVRERIINSNNQRNLFVLKTDNTQRLIDGFRTYHWKLDAKGNITDKPDHTEESDIMDAVRYLYQNVYGKSTKINFAMASGEKSLANKTNNELMKSKIKDLAIKETPKTTQTSKKKIFWM